MFAAGFEFEISTPRSDGARGITAGERQVATQSPPVAMIWMLDDQRVDGLDRAREVTVRVIGNGEFEAKCCQ